MPESLIPHCPTPPFSGETLGDQADYVIPLLDALEDCQRQIEALRAWRPEA